MVWRSLWNVSFVRQYSKFPQHIIRIVNTTEYASIQHILIHLDYFRKRLGETHFEPPVYLTYLMEMGVVCQVIACNFHP